MLQQLPKEWKNTLARHGLRLARSKYNPKIFTFGYDGQATREMHIEKAGFFSGLKKIGSGIVNATRTYVLNPIGKGLQGFQHFVEYKIDSEDTVNNTIMPVKCAQMQKYPFLKFTEDQLSVKWTEAVRLRGMKLIPIFWSTIDSGSTALLASSTITQIPTLPPKKP